MKQSKLPKGLNGSLGRVARHSKKRYLVALTAGAGALAYLLKRRNHTDDSTVDADVYPPIRLGQGELDPQRQAQYSGVVTSFIDEHPKYRLRIDTGLKCVEVTIPSSRRPNCDQDELVGNYALVFTDGSEPAKDEPIEALEIQLIRR